MADNGATGEAKEVSRNTFDSWQALTAQAAAERISAVLAGVPEAERAVAIRRLASSDEQVTALQEGRSPAPREERRLSGVPFLIKDLFDRAGEVTAAGSLLLGEIGGAAARDAPAVEQLMSARAACIGRTHMNEFAYGLDGKNAHFGNCVHPHDPERISGGSSSGSAWAVGKGVVPLALGTDTGGSIRVPASLCGIFGFRRCVDLWATEGVFPLSRTFDTAGWFTSNAEDMRRCLELFYPEPPAPAEQITVAWVAPEGVAVEPALREAYQAALRRCFPTDNRLDSDAARFLTEESDAVREAYNIIGSSDAYEVHREWLDERKQQYDPAVWPLIERGRHWSESDRSWAHEMQKRVADAFARLFESVDAVAMPAVHTTAPRHSEVDSEYRRRVLTLNAPASHAGLAALTVPVRSNSGNGTGGIQLVVARGREREVCSALLRRVQEHSTAESPVLLPENL